MPPAPILTENTLFYGDNLPILREYIADESVDLVYLDPPFNSAANYNVLFKDEKGVPSQAQIQAFQDTWHWDRSAEAIYYELVTDISGEIGTMIGAMRSFIGTSPVMSYLVMMAIRLHELRRVLQPTGSIYLHCDPTASHYLKVVMDTIFGAENYVNEISWKRTTTKSDFRQGAINWPRIRDVILHYRKDVRQKGVFNQPFAQYSDEYVASKYRHKDPDGRAYMLDKLTAPGSGSRGHPQYEFMGVTRHWVYNHEKMEAQLAAGRIVQPSPGSVPRYKRYLDEVKGVAIGDTWDDIPAINSMAIERLGYPTQKPMALLERIIAASSNPGDMVLDPFCGCGTAVAAAHKLGRRWVGIDITHLSIALQKYRLEQSFPGISFTVVGEPEDIGAARQLAQEDRYQFQWWALSLIRARPLGGEAGSKQGKKGSDKGIDGVITFLDDASGKPKRVLIQVKSGKVKSGDIRDLVGTLQREAAQIGVFLTLEEPSRDMLTEAASAGVYRAAHWGRDFPKLQILTIAELLRGAEIKMPPAHGTFKQAQRVQQPDAEQQGFDL